MIFRSSRPEVFCQKGVLRNFAKFTGKHLCQSLFFNKITDGAFFTEHLFYRAPLVAAFGFYKKFSCMKELASHFVSSYLHS